MSQSIPEDKKRNPHNVSDQGEVPHPKCPLLAKDSEWVDILQNSQAETSRGSSSSDEEILQLVDSEDGPETKPLTTMFPGLLDKDPQTLQRVLNRTMSTTEVTKQLVGLGQKANFTFMKKAERLIPKDKEWMESVAENSNSYYSINTRSRTEDSLLSDNENENADLTKRKEMRNNLNGPLIIKSQTDLNDTTSPSTLANNKFREASSSKD